MNEFENQIERDAVITFLKRIEKQANNHEITFQRNKHGNIWILFDNKVRATVLPNKERTEYKVFAGKFGA